MGHKVKEDQRKTQHEHFNMLDKSSRSRNHKLSDSSTSESNTIDCYSSVLTRHTCTDIIFTLIFLVFISALVAVSVFAYVNGNPNDLLLPHDSEGNLCGKSEGYENKPYLFFFDITKCISITTAINGCSTKQTCVEECPSKNAYKKIQSHLPRIEKFCDTESNCPDYLLKSAPVFGRCVPEVIAKILNASEFVIKAFDEVHDEYVPIQVTSINGTSDLTLDRLKENVNYLKTIVNMKEVFELAYEDLSQCVWIILLGLILGAIISFLWMFILRFIIKPMIYLTILIVLVLLGFGTYFCANEYIVMKKGNIKPDKEIDLNLDFSDLKYLANLKETWLVVGILLGVLFLILFFVVIFIHKRISMAAELIKEVSKAIVLIPSSLVWPFVPFIIEIGIIVYCSSVALYLASSGVKLYQIVDTNLTNNTANFTNNYYDTYLLYEDEPRVFLNKSENLFQVGDYCQPEFFYKMKNSRPNDTSIRSLECYFFRFGFDTKLGLKIGSETVSEYYTRLIEFINEYQWLPQVYVIFMLFWLTAFMIGLNEMTLAGSFGAWYWTRFNNLDKSYENRLPTFTVIGALGRAVFYHLGTIAFGSLLIAIIKIIRVILEYLSSKLKPKVNESKIAKYLVCCLKCCFWCLERFIKFLNRYAFIITAVYSLNFCKAAKKAFNLITSNVLRVIVIDKITSFILFLSNVAITAMVGILAFFFFTKKLPIDALMRLTPDLNYYFVPLFVIIFGVFTITKLFFDVFSMGVDTLLICVLIDLDLNDGTKQRPYFMSTNLKKILHIKNKRHED